MTYVVDWNNICLVCLQKGDNLCVFQKDEESNLSVADKIMKCSDFMITKSNEQPNTICPSCLSDLNTAYKFRQNCEQSSSIINAIISQDNLKLEISGLRIKIPFGLKVTKKLPTTQNDEVPLPIQQEEIKDEHIDIKYSDEDEDFDTNDYMESTEILDDIEEQNEKEITTYIEDAEHLELISELNEIEKEVDEDLKNRIIIPKKRGRGRPKKVDSSDSNCKNETQEAKVTARRGLTRRHKGPQVVKPPKICEICGNSYKFQHALNSHMRRHKNERPFTCDFCDKAFVSAVELRRHMRVHTGQKPYECSYCERRFSDYGSRIKHERTHTGERPYECATCGKSFAYAHVLTVHMRTHTGEKKFICTECGRGFTKKLYLENHMSHHLTGTLRKRNPTLEEVMRECETGKVGGGGGDDNGSDYSRREYDDGNLIDSYESEHSKLKEEDEPDSHESDLYSLHQVQ